MKFTECYYTYQDSLSLNWAYWNNSNLFLVEGRTLFFSSRALWASLKTFAVVDSLPDIWRSSLAPNNIKSLSISPRCRKICRPPRAEEKHSLRQTVKTISSRPNLGISQTNHGVTQAREGMTVLTGLFFFFSLQSNAHWCPDHRLLCWGIPRKWHIWERGRGSHNCCLSLKYFYPMDLFRWQFLSVVGYFYPFRVSPPKPIYTTSVQHSWAFEFPLLLSRKQGC